MKLRKNICEDCCKGKRISELDEKVDIQGTEYIPFLEGNDNGKFSLGSLKDYLTKLIEEYLINNGIIREDWVQSEPAYKLLATLPELIADRACKDEFGNNINDTYLTREAVKEYIGTIYEDLFVNNPPQILDGFITVDMLSDAVLQLLNSGGAITNFPDDEDITVKDGKLKFKDKVYDPNNYSGMGRTILRKNMVDGVNVLTQEMMSEPNVIYVIQYDYDLRGETIVVPDNSILWYLGGSLNNGHITSNDEDRLIIWGNLNGDIEIDIDVSLVGAPADEEDITTESGVLKFKDKEYDTASFSGLGRKYLRKNIVNGKNILTQEMINSANTRYIIQYDYDLNEETITIPEGCTLDFQGGSLNNGTINFPKGTYIRNLYKGTATITGNPIYIDYLADEEDVTTENGILKFKDKEYSSSDFSGLGRKYLRKNIVDGKNILTQEMISEPNQIYIILYDYDLRGETINILDNCTLEFNGGSLSNGTLHGTNTSILTGISYIFNNMTFDGDWKVPFIYPEYFGAKGDGVTDDRDAIQKSLDSNISNTIKLLQKTYIIKSYITLEEYNYGIVIPTRKILLGSNTSNYTKDSKILISKDIDVHAFIKLKDRNTTIKDILVEGELKEDGSLILSHGIYTGVGSFAYIILENVKVKNCGRNGFDLGTYLSNIKLCNADTCGLYGFYIHGGPGSNTSTILNTCYSNTCKAGGYFIEKMTYSLLINCACDYCGFTNDDLKDSDIGYAYTFLSSKNIVVSGCGCENCYKIFTASKEMRGLLIDSGFFLLKEDPSSYPEDFNYATIINLDSIANSTIKNSLLGINFTNYDKIISGTKNTYLSIENCYIKRPNGTYRNFNLNHVTELGNIVINNYVGKYTLESGYIDNVLTYNDTTILLQVNIKAADATFNDLKEYRNINGIVNIYPIDSLSLNHGYSTLSMNITNCNTLNFYNFALDFSKYLDTKDAFFIRDSTITFTNIDLIGIRSNTIKMFNLENSTLIFNNYNFKNSYSYSENIEDYFTLNNSRVIFVNDKISYLVDDTNPLHLNMDGTLTSKVTII